jgi:hypothetical protein
MQISRIRLSDKTSRLHPPVVTSEVGTAEPESTRNGGVDRSAKVLLGCNNQSCQLARGSFGAIRPDCSIHSQFVLFVCQRQRSASCEHAGRVSEPFYLRHRGSTPHIRPTFASSSRITFQEARVAKLVYSPPISATYSASRSKHARTIAPTRAMFHPTGTCL